jgi:hypothetical protein
MLKKALAGARDIIGRMDNAKMIKAEKYNPKAFP